MIKLWKFTLFFLLCLVIALLLNLPIQHVLPQVKLPDTVRLSGINGTVVRGTAEEISINNFPVRAVNYRYMPSCIPLLKVCYKIDYEQGELQVAYDILNGDTEVSKTLIEYQAAELVRHIPNSLVKPAGRLELKIDDLTLLEGKPAVVNGQLIWRDLGIDDDGIKVNVGDYQVDFSGNPQKYDFRIKDLDADLDVSGKGEISPDGQYMVDVRIASDDSIDPNVKNVLSLVAGELGYNKYRLERKGRLPPHITRQLFK